jgi:hypothetical protein
MAGLEFMERHGLSTRAATHKAQENSKSKDDKSSAITTYVIALNIKKREIKPQFILRNPKLYRHGM